MIVLKVSFVHFAGSVKPAGKTKVYLLTIYVEIKP